MKYILLLLSMTLCLNMNGQGLQNFKLSEGLSKGAGKTYGAYCGIAGQHPPTRIAVEKLIEAEDLSKLEEWLNSPNLVVQTYAAEAFIRLSERLDLSQEVMYQVEVIRNKDEIITTCKGCVYDKLTIKECLEGVKPMAKSQNNKNVKSF